VNVIDRPISDAIVTAWNEAPAFAPGDLVRVLDRAPIGHYRVPTYLRGRSGVVEKIVTPALLDNEEEGFGRNAGNRRFYYRIAVPMTELWPGYRGGAEDGLRIEVFESWLERIPA